MKKIVIFAVFVMLFLSACTVDENGIRDPVAEAKASVKLTEAQIKSDDAAIARDLEARQTDARVSAAAVVAQAQADAVREIARAFADAARIVLVLGAVGVVIWIAGLSYSRARNAVLESGYVKIGVEPSTLLPPPFVFTVDGYMIDTRSGERARLRDAASVDRLRLAATTQQSNIAMLARSAERIADKRHPQAAQVAEQLGVIAPSVKMIDMGEIK